jgi:hypothetical protein
LRLRLSFHLVSAARNSFMAPSVRCSLTCFRPQYTSRIRLPSNLSSHVRAEWVVHLTEHVVAGWAHRDRADHRDSGLPAPRLDPTVAVPEAITPHRVPVAAQAVRAGEGPEHPHHHLRWGADDGSTGIESSTLVRVPSAIGKDGGASGWEVEREAEAPKLRYT